MGNNEMRHNSKTVKSKNQVFCSFGPVLEDSQSCGSVGCGLQRKQSLTKLFTSIKNGCLLAHHVLLVGSRIKGDVFISISENVFHVL
ncbi:hypothetical protein I3760_03G029600 [Carya illinoinensis]|nr:hypothetical protein I3760_03G029600 [Carya illinoinensis]